MRIEPTTYALKEHGSQGEPLSPPPTDSWPAGTPLPPLDTLATPLRDDLRRDYAWECAVWEADLAKYRQAAAMAPSAHLHRSALGNVARVLGHLGYVAHRQGRYAAAARYHQENLLLERDLLDALGIGLCLLDLGDALGAQRDETAARARYEEALGVAEGLGDGWLYAVVSERLGHSGRGLAAPTPWYGRRVDVGGHGLYAYTAGAGVLGSPTVVLEADLGTPWTNWTDGADAAPCHPGIAADVASLTRVVAYSRAGVRDSEPGPLPRTGRRIVADLRALLESLALPRPYVLVGHGFGCLTTALFAALHPDEVAGLVLLDAPGIDTPGLDNPEHVDYAETERQIRAGPPLPAVPVVCVTPRWRCSSYRQRDGTAAQPRDLDDARASAVRRFGAAVRLLVAERSGHQIPSDEPDLVVEVTRQVVEAARRHSATCGPHGRAATTAVERISLVAE